MPLRAQTADLVNAPVDPAIRVVLRGQHAPWALPRNIQGPVPGDTMLEHLTLVLKRSPQRQKAFEQFLQQLQDPASPNYHRFLTPVQVGKRFGASEHDIDAISAVAPEPGLARELRRQQPHDDRLQWQCCAGRRCLCHRDALLRRKWRAAHGDCGRSPDSGGVGRSHSVRQRSEYRQ